MLASHIPFYFQEGDWNVPHSLALFDESDVLCVADREGERVDCMKAGIERPLYANRDETGQKITSYKRVGRPYAIDAKGKVQKTILYYLRYILLNVYGYVKLKLSI